MRWEEMTSPEIDALDRDTTIVILPIGSVEQHGRHMPLGTDTILAQSVAIAAAEQLQGVVVMPPPWYGFSAHHMRFPGSVTLQAETLLALVSDIIASVVRHGFRRVLIVNGHGGNGGAIDVLASTLGHRHYGTARIATLTYFALAAEAITRLRRSGPGGMGHAGEFETSMIQHLRSELVKIDRAETTYPDPGSPHLTTDLVGSQVPRVYHDFADLSPSGTLGDPSLASPEAGEAFFAASVTALANFLKDFRTWQIPGGNP